MRELPVWVVYDHPKDFPAHYVARLWEGLNPTQSFVQSDKLEIVRAVLGVEMRLTCLPRHPNDDPSIIETWF
jgi:hypothetical protein